MGGNDAHKLSESSAAWYTAYIPCVIFSANCGGLDKYDSEETVVPTTHYRLRVSDDITGDIEPGQVIELEMMGGVVDGVRFVVDDVSAVEVGRKYLVFSSKTTQSTYRVRGANAGIAASVDNNKFELTRAIGGLVNSKSVYTINELKQKISTLNLAK